MSRNVTKISPKKISHKSYFTYLVLLFGIICIGFSAIFVKFANVGGSVSAFYRIFFASIIVVPLWLISKRKMPPKKFVWLTIAGGIFFAIDLALWNTSILLTTAAESTLLANNAPLWVGLGTLFFFHEKLHIKYWLGLGIALSGMILLVGSEALQTMDINTGNLLAITASFFYAAYLLLTQKARKGIDTISFMAISVLTCLVILFIMNLIMDSQLTGYSDTTWFSLAGLGLVSHVGGWISINYALGRLPAAPVSVSLLGQTVVTALVAMPLLGETLGVFEIIGGLMVLSGIYFSNQKQNQNK